MSREYPAATEYPRFLRELRWHMHRRNGPSTTSTSTHQRRQQQSNAAVSHTVEIHRPFVHLRNHPSTHHGKGGIRTPTATAATSDASSQLQRHRQRRSASSWAVRQFFDEHGFTDTLVPPAEVLRLMRRGGSSPPPTADYEEVVGQEQRQRPQWPQARPASAFVYATGAAGSRRCSVIAPVSAASLPPKQQPEAVAERKQSVLNLWAAVAGVRKRDSSDPSNCGDRGVGAQHHRGPVAPPWALQSGGGDRGASTDSAARHQWQLKARSSFLSKRQRAWTRLWGSNHAEKFLAAQPLN